MVAIKTLPSTRAHPEYRQQNLYPDHKESKPLYPFSGFIFVCNNDTIPDLDRKIFGLPAYHAQSVRAIKKGMPLFLFNYTTRCLCGVFEAASDGGLNLDPYAWENTEVRMLGGSPVSRYPAQVRVRLRFQRPPLNEDCFRPILDHVHGHKFRLELTTYQVQQLLKLFCVPEREFFGDKSRKWPYSTSICTYLPESPRSAFKSDSDCYSECSSKGTYYGEDEWVDEESASKEYAQLCFALGNGDQSLSEGLSQMSLNDTQINHHKLSDENLMGDFHYDTSSMFSTPFTMHTWNSVPPGGHQQTIWKRNIGNVLDGSWCQTIDPTDANQMHSRFYDVDPAVNSNAIDPVQPGFPYQSLSTRVEDDVEASPFMPAQFQSPYLENMIYIPVHMQPRQLASHSKQAKETDQKKLSDGLFGSLQEPNSEKIEKVVNSSDLKSYQQPCPMYLQGSPYGQVMVPFGAAVPGALYEPNHMTTLLSPVLVSPFVHPQAGYTGEFEDGQGALDPSQLHIGGYHSFLQSAHFPVLLVPSVIPRMTISPPTGFIEALHFDILQFVRLTRPSAEAQLLVEDTIDCIRSCVRMVWPEADIEVFGSFATGLCLQHSDVDLAVVNAPLLPALVNMTTSQASAFLLRELGLLLKSSQCCDNYNVIANASVPVLKCICRPMVKLSDSSLAVPSIAIDITIGGIKDSIYEWNQVLRGSNVGKPGPQHTGGAAREYVLRKIQELPALAPLVLLMKSYLHHKGLSNVYLGGLGSFSLTLLLAYYLERVSSSGDTLADKVGASKQLPFPFSSMSDSSEDYDGQYSSYKADGLNWSLGKLYVRRAAGAIEKALSIWDAGGVANLGTLLLGFLRNFGFERKLSREKIVLKGLDGSRGGIFKRDNKHIAVWIDDPLRPGVNIAAGSFAMCQVQAAFREMLLVLANGHLPLSPFHCNENECQDLAAFGQLSQLSRLLTDGDDRQ